MEALKHPRHWHNNRIYSSLCATTDTNPRQFTPTRIHITAPRRPHGRADVSTCLPITDCSGIVDREGGRSFSFVLPTSLSRVCSPPLQAVTSSPILLFYTHRFHFFVIPFFVFLYRYQSDRSLTPLFPFLSFSSLAGTSTKRKVYKFAWRNCHEKYGILSASKATLVAV